MTNPANSPKGREEEEKRRREGAKPKRPRK